jgi:membrane protein
MTKNKISIIARKIANKIVETAKSVSLPGLEKVPVYDVGVFYINGIANGAIGVRASAISFSFFMALFPSIIFIFTLIPFVPIPNFQNELLSLMEQLLPSNTYQAIESTIVDIMTNKRLSLLSFGFIAAMLFSTNGISAMIASFNASVNAFETRKWVSMRLIAILLVFIIFLLITVAIGLIIFGKHILNILVSNSVIHGSFSQILFISGQWIIIIAFLLFCIAFVYYYAPSKRSKYRFVSPGSIMATLLIILSSLAFSYYLGHFARYNKLYGSIGTLIALLVWMNLNSYMLLIGFELNVSIRNAKVGLSKDLELSKSTIEYERFYPKKEDLLKDL